MIPSSLRRMSPSKPEERVESRSTGKRARLRRRRPGVLSLVAVLLVASALARISGETGEDLSKGWRFLSAWAQSTEENVPEEEGLSPTRLDAADAMIEALVRRENAIVARERSLEERQRSLELAEAELLASTAELEAAEVALRRTLALADGAAQTDLDRLTRMYEAMKPKDAAAVFETMDPTFAAGFLGQMSPAAAAEILAGLPPETAYSVSLVLAGRNMGVPVD